MARCTWLLISALTLAACGGDADLPDSGHPPVESDTPGGSPTADQLRNRLAACGTPIGGPYATDIESAPTVDICATGNAIFWTADLDVDCDGKPSTLCNPDTDDAFQDETSATDVTGAPLDATQLPYVVVPLPSARFDSPMHDITLGTVIAVVYQQRVRYGVFADEGPEEIIGEASHAMAESLGIDPDPNTGGTDGPVLYVAFPGTTIDPIESHQQATSIGAARALVLVSN